MIDLSIVVVTYNTKELTLKCLETIFNNPPKAEFEVILVDNASVDGTYEEVQSKMKKVKLIKSDTNLGFAGGNNLGIAESKGKWCLLLNSDTEVLPQSLDSLLKYSELGGYGIVSAKLLNKDLSFQPNGGKQPSLMSNFVWISGLDDVLPNLLGKYSYQMRSLNDFQDSSVGWVSATAMLISKKCINEIGLLDDRIFMYAEDVDYCIRASEAGYRIGWCDLSEIVHLGGGSSKKPKLTQLRGEIKGLLYVYKKHFGYLKYIIFSLMIRPFLFARSLVFLLLGRFSLSSAYAKIIFTV